jgi:hypothetical protein
MLDKYAIMAAWIVAILSSVAPALACNEAKIHQEARECYYNCVTHYFDEPSKQQCIADCVRIQDEEREAAGCVCDIIAGSKICH